jgi:hypothetical protein
MISLTREDWCEIYYALELKSRALRERKDDSEDYKGQDADWITQLERL